MKMIKPHVELLTQQYDKLGIFEMVELAGRTQHLNPYIRPCYLKV